MNDITTTPLNLLTDARQFLAPCWHRRYVWPTEFTLHLLDNVLRAGSDQDYTSFGVVTVGIRPQDPSHLMIVNGQQRLVTFALILLALVNSLRERSSGILHDESGAKVLTEAEIVAKYMYLPANGGICDRRLRLYAEDDDGALEAFIEGKRLSKRFRTSNMCKPYEALIRRMAKVDQLNVVFNGLNELRGGLMEMHGSERQMVDQFSCMNMSDASRQPRPGRPRAKRTGLLEVARRVDPLVLRSAR